MNSGQRPKSSYVRGQSAFAALWSILVLLAGLVVLPIAAHAAFTEIGPSPLGDENGTSYGIRVPDNYNGLLIIDLDYVTARNSARATYWLGKGYAYAGINRPPLRRTQSSTLGRAGPRVTRRAPRARRGKCHRARRRSTRRGCGNTPHG